MITGFGTAIQAAAGQAAIFLAQQGADVTITIRGESLESSMSAYLIDRIEAAPNIRLETRTEVTALHGDDRLTEITVTYRDTGAETRRDCCGLFDTDDQFPNAARAEREVLHIPAYPELSDGQVDEIARKVKQVGGTVDTLYTAVATFQDHTDMTCHYGVEGLR